MSDQIRPGANPELARLQSVGDTDADILDPNTAHERLAAWKGRIDKLAADTQAMSTRMRGLRITASDPAGLAEVTVDSTGMLVDLRLTDRIHRATPTTVAQAVMATLRDARNKVAERSQEIITETMGADSAAGRAIADSVGRQLRGGPAPGRTGDPDDEEDFDTRSPLHRG